MSPRLNVLIVFLLLATCCFGQQHKTKEELQLDSVHSMLQGFYKNNAPGISISIIRKGKSIFKSSYGLADLRTKTVLDSKTNFNIGSLTKQFTAFAILQLVKKKKISLEDHLSKFFPEMNKKVADIITVQELLTHSSGIIDHYDLADTKKMKHAHIDDVFNAIKNIDSTYFIPGSSFRYSNTAYCLLALIIEKASGMGYVNYLKKNIFLPLGMKQTSVWNEKEKIENSASGYEFDKTTNDFKRSGPDENIFFSTEGDGGIYTSIDDYSRWFEGLQSGNALSKEIIQEARSAQFTFDKENHLSYGYGWFINESSLLAKVYHGGSNGGFRAYSYSIPAENFLIVIFSNRDDVDLEKLVKRIYAILYPEPVLHKN